MSEGGGSGGNGEGRVYVGELELAAQKAREVLLGKEKPRFLGKLVDWGTLFSLWPIHFTTSCCGCEFAATWSPRFDAERYGALPWLAPRQTNLIVIEGTVTKKMACALRLVWEQMPHPKFAIAMGACALDGGIFYNSYNIVRPWEIVPVDVYIPGCPPRPEALARAIVELQKLIKEKGLASLWISRGVREDKPTPELKEDPCFWWKG